MDYETLPRAALIRMLQEHDAALADAGKNGIVMSYTGASSPMADYSSGEAEATPDSQKGLLR